MKKKEIKEEKKQEEMFTPTLEPCLGDNTWLLGILTLLMMNTPKSESKTTINIYTGSDK